MCADCSRRHCIHDPKGSKLAFTPGELLIFCDAVSYAITVVVMDIVTVDDNALNIGVFHLFFIGFFSLLAAFAFEDFTIPTSAPEWGAILYLGTGVRCHRFHDSAGGTEIHHAWSEPACMWRPTLTAVILGVIFLGERFTFLGIIGCGLILLSIFLPAALENGLARKKA